MRKFEHTSFGIVRLDLTREESWAVIGLPSGSIVVDMEGRLMMRMSKPAAQALAERYTQSQSFGFGDRRPQVGFGAGADPEGLSLRLKAH